MQNKSRSNKVLALALMLCLVPFVMATHDNNACETTKVTSDMVSRFVIMGNVVSGTEVPEFLIEGQSVTVESQIVFKEGTPQEELTLEVGLYPADSDQALAIVKSATSATATPTRNCVLNEEFVDTIHVTPSKDPISGEFPNVRSQFTLTAPTDADLNDGGSREYIFQAVLFKNCYKACAGTTGSGIIAFVSEPVLLKDNPALSADAATDGVKNGDESDIDCGGSTGVACPLGYSCQSAGDCTDGMVCQKLAAKTQSVCSEPSLENSTSAIQGSPALLIGLAGIALVGIAYASWRKRR